MRYKSTENSVAERHQTGAWTGKVPLWFSGEKEAAWGRKRADRYREND